MAQMRWGAEAPSDNDAARKRLIDAAEACFSRYGVMKTTVEDVANVANVSRATVYRYFGGRDELILGVLLRDGTRFLDGLGRHIDQVEDLQDVIVEGVLHALHTIRQDENLALLFRPDNIGLTTSIAGASNAVFDLTASFLRPYLEQGRADGTLRSGLDLDEAAEWMLRAILTLLTVEGPRKRDEADLRMFLHTFLVPSLIANPRPPS